jgi:3-hydroxybutyryl-CoA dehydrogenase
VNESIERVAILGGGGLMGHGIALACLWGDVSEVLIVSRREQSVERGLELVASGPFGLEKAVARGKLDAQGMERMRSRLRGTTDYAELADVQLIFESIPEVPERKLEALKEAEQAASSDVLIATNTSSIMIAELAAALEDPGRLVGTHWFYPSNVLPLVEVARGELTRPATTDAVVELLRRIGKRPVVVSDGPGFFMTRFVNVYVAEAIRLVELGIAGPAEVDEMVKTGLGWPMGVFELLDDAAMFDAWYHAQEYLHETCGERYAVPPLARRAFKAGFLGDAALKPGSRGGFYEFLSAERA